MAKTIIREVIIALLVCLAVLLILSVVLYNYIPTNKVIPEVVEYTPSKEIQAQLNAEVDDNSDEIIMTYEVTASDLDRYEKSNEYNPGKVNPFAAVSESTDGTSIENGSSGQITGENIKPNGTTSNSGGSLFENGTSK